MGRNVTIVRIKKFLVVNGSFWEHGYQIFKMAYKAGVNFYDLFLLTD